MGANRRHKRAAGRRGGVEGDRTRKKERPAGRAVPDNDAERIYWTFTALQAASTAAYSAESAPYRSVAAFNVASMAPA
jgi:hypothetical protein